MSKLIKMTPELIQQCQMEFAEALSKGKFADGKVSYTKMLGNLEEKATVYFMEKAWQKMQALVREFDKEIAWHGIAHRGSDKNKHEYLISDIIVYPQEVTSVTVDTDQAEYQSWLMNHDDEVFNNIRMQGHSHVHMATSPSGTDIHLYDRILEQLDDTMFYIFMIWNKRKDKYIKIYDMEKNIMFETTDVTVTIIDDGTGIEQFVKDAKEMVKNKVVTYPTYGSKSYPANTTTPATKQSDNHHASSNTNKDNKTPYSSYSEPSGVKKNESPSSSVEEFGKKIKKHRKGKRTKFKTKNQFSAEEIDEAVNEVYRERGLC